MKTQQTGNLLVALVLVMGTVLACGGGGGGADPTPAEVIFQDNFDNTDTGWEVGDYDDGNVGYKDGTYFVTSTRTDFVMWGVANRTFDDFAIELDATQIAAGPENNNAYGIVCREQGNGDGYYLRVSGDGFYSIAKAEGGTFETLVDWTESSAINKGNATNRLRILCDGATLALYANGRQLEEVEDSTFATGDIALTATTYEDAPTEIHFDNLVVSKP